MNNYKPKNVENELKDIKGKMLYEKIMLQYSNNIIDEIQKDPDVIKKLLEELELDYDDFINIITNKNENITFYEHTLKLVKELNNSYSENYTYRK